jgi:hypothetical protein
MASTGLCSLATYTHAWPIIGTTDALPELSLMINRVCLRLSSLSVAFFVLLPEKRAKLMIYINEPVDVWLPPSPHKHTGREGRGGSPTRSAWQTIKSFLPLKSRS